MSGIMAVASEIDRLEKTISKLEIEKKALIQRLYQLKNRERLFEMTVDRQAATIQKLNSEKDTLIRALTKIHDEVLVKDFLPEDESEDFLAEIWEVAQKSLLKVGRGNEEVQQNDQNRVG